MAGRHTISVHVGSLTFTPAGFDAALSELIDACDDEAAESEDPRYSARCSAAATEGRRQQRHFREDMRQHGIQLERARRS